MLSWAFLLAMQGEVWSLASLIWAGELQAVFKALVFTTTTNTCSENVISPGMTTKSVFSACIPPHFCQITFKSTYGMHSSFLTAHLVSCSKWWSANPLVCRQPPLVLTPTSYPSRQLFLWHCFMLQDYIQEQFHTICWHCQRYCNVEVSFFSLPKVFMMTDSVRIPSAL